MKACTVFVASAVVAMVSIDSVAGYAKYLQAIPNGDSFEKALGHKGDAGYTEFGSAFSAVGSWTEAFCKEKFPGTTMTNGAAFGDPCCTWKAGGKADKTVTAFTDKPTTETTCAASTPAVTPAAAPAATPAAPAAAATPAPAGKPAAPAPAPAGKPASPAPAPAGKPVVPGPAPAGKPSKCKVKEEKSLDDEESNTDDEEIDY